MSSLNFRTIRCKNSRPRPIHGKMTPDALCNRIMGCVNPDLDQTIILFCPTCKTFWQVKIEHGRASMRAVDKKRINFRNDLESSVKGYEYKIA